MLRKRMHAQKARLSPVYGHSRSCRRTLLDPDFGRQLSSVSWLQAWVYAMEWYAEQRQRIEDEIQKYSDPPSEHMLPELPPHARWVRPKLKFATQGAWQASITSPSGIVLLAFAIVSLPGLS